MPEVYRIIYTRDAADDLEEIFEYIVQSSPQNAQKVADEIVQSIDDLKTFPHRFSPARNRSVNPREIRAMVVRPFLVEYRIDESTKVVFILSVRRGTRQRGS